MEDLKTLLEKCNFDTMKEVGIEMNSLLTKSELSMLEALIVIKTLEESFISACGKLMGPEEEEGIKSARRLFDELSILYEVQKEVKESRSET